mgnify:CR=1 FL=1
MRRLVSAFYHDFYPFHTFLDWSGMEAVEAPEDLKESDVLIVWGGADIHPSFYNQKPGRRMHVGPFPSRRDTIEWELMRKAKEMGVPIIGVCRGAQMLCALEGGTLVQDVQNHGGNHLITTNGKQNYIVNSIHHQMMNPKNTEHQLIGWSSHKLSREYHSVDEDGKDIVIEMDVEPELIYFPNCKGLAVQWHPEAMNRESQATKHLQTIFTEQMV